MKVTYSRPSKFAATVSSALLFWLIRDLLITDVIKCAELGMGYILVYSSTDCSGDYYSYTSVTPVLLADSNSTETSDFPYRTCSAVPSDSTLYLSEDDDTLGGNYTDDYYNDDDSWLRSRRMTEARKSTNLRGGAKPASWWNFTDDWNSTYSWNYTDDNFSGDPTSSLHDLLQYVQLQCSEDTEIPVASASVVNR
jgi:hypothetical protein